MATSDLKCRDHRPPKFSAKVLTEGSIDAASTTAPPTWSSITLAWPAGAAPPRPALCAIWGNAGNYQTAPTHTHVSMLYRTSKTWLQYHESQVHRV